jgi:hypothetical protein
MRASTDAIRGGGVLEDTGGYGDHWPVRRGVTVPVEAAARLGREMTMGVFEPVVPEDVPVPSEKMPEDVFSEDEKVVDPSTEESEPDDRTEGLDPEATMT